VSLALYLKLDQRKEMGEVRWQSIEKNQRHKMKTRRQQAIYVGALGEHNINTQNRQKLAKECILQKL